MKKAESIYKSIKVSIKNHSLNRPLSGWTLSIFVTSIFMAYLQDDRQTELTNVQTRFKLGQIVPVKVYVHLYTHSLCNQGSRSKSVRVRNGVSNGFFRVRVDARIRVRVRSWSFLTEKEFETNRKGVVLRKPTLTPTLTPDAELCFALQNCYKL